ncbi:3',5'-cyclic-AMP phosphodiesterase [Parasalinivibrio latis]
MDKKKHESITLLQLTDTHLYADPAGNLLGVNTLDSFHAVLEAVDDANIAFDAIVATGDISQDHSDVSYQRFADGITRWTQPCYWLPGNHDYQPEMESILNAAQLHRGNIVNLGEYWQMVMLDSQVPGVPHGELSDSQFEMLENALSNAGEKHILVLLHHHPIAAGSAWLDQHQLHNNERFWEIVSAYPHVKGVVCGHIHQALDYEYQGVRVMASPSTCIQFMPDSDNFALDLQNPGWRTLTLNADGSMDSGVFRIEGVIFSPDLQSGGY